MIGLKSESIVTVCLLKTEHKNNRYKSHIFKQNYLQKYDHLQRPDAAGFCHGVFNS